MVTGALMVPVLFLFIHWGGWAYAALVVALVAAGSWEWARLAGLGRVERVWLVCGAAGLCLAVAFLDRATLLFALAGWLLATLLGGLSDAGGGSRRRSGDLLLGILYVGLLPGFLLLMRSREWGREAVFLTYATAFSCDVAAYAVGRTLGRRPLWQRVSPRKTWEGACAGLGGAILAAMIGQAWFAGFLSPWRAAGFGLIVGVAGQAGDLVESLWKREGGIKDSSSLFPGHGGVLDRFDNLHFVAPILYIYLVACG